MARRTKEDALATRTALLDAAECVFLRRGVSRTSLADIAQAAGLTRGALYWHFKDKVALLDGMLERVVLPMGNELQVLRSRDDDVLAEWRAYLRRALHQIVHDEQTRRVLQIAMQKIEHTEELAPLIDNRIQLHRRKSALEREVLERAARACGRVLPAPAAQLAHGFHGMVHGLIYGWLLDDSFDLEAAGEASIDAFLRGIGLAPPLVSA